MPDLQRIGCRSVGQTGDLSAMRWQRNGGAVQRTDGASPGLSPVPWGRENQRDPLQELWGDRPCRKGGDDIGEDSTGSG